MVAERKSDQTREQHNHSAKGDATKRAQAAISRHLVEHAGGEFNTETPRASAAAAVSEIQIAGAAREASQTRTTTPEVKLLSDYVPVASVLMLLGLHACPDACRLASMSLGLHPCPHSIGPRRDFLSSI